MSTTDTNTELELVPAQQPGETMKRADLPVIWEGYATQAEKLKATAETLTVTSIDQVTEMKLARATRLALKNLRVEIEHKRKELVEDMTKQTAAINGEARKLKSIIEPLEERLEEQENFIARETLRIEDENRTARHAEIAPFLTGPLSLDLGKMPDEDFAKMLADAKDLAALREERIRKEKEEAEAKSKAESEERERIRLENEELKRQAEEAKRLALIEDRIQAIREGETDVLRVCKTIESIEKEIEYVEARPVTEELFQERIEDAKSTKYAVLKAMRAILDERKAAEEAARKEREETARLASEAKAKADAELAAAQDKSREDAIAAQKAREKEQAAFEAENEKQRLAHAAVVAKAKKEREAIEAKAKAEKEASDKENARLAAIAEAERQKAATAAREAKEAREKIEDEERARKALAAKAEDDRLEAERQAALAPEKDKLLAFAKTVLNLSLPEMATEKGQAAAAEIESQVVKFAAFIEKKAGAL